VFLYYAKKSSYEERYVAAQIRIEGFYFLIARMRSMFI